MELIGFRFENLDEIQWEKMYALAVAYYEEHGNVEIPFKFKTINGYEYDEEGLALGAWCNNKRKRANTLTIEQRRKLELISFRFITVKESEEKKISLCTEYGVDYSKYGFLNNISYQELYAKIQFLIDNEIPLESGNKLHEIFYMSNENMKAKYNVSKEQLIEKYYINRKERGV